MGQAASQDAGTTTITSTVNRLTVQGASDAAPNGTKKPVSSKAASSWGPFLSVPTNAQRASSTISVKRDLKPAEMEIASTRVDSRLPTGKLSTPDTLTKRHSSARTGASSRSMADVEQTPARFAHLEKKNSSEPDHLSLKTGISINRSPDLRAKGNIASAGNGKDTNAKSSKAKGKEISKLRLGMKNPGGTRGR